MMKIVSLLILGTILLVGFSRGEKRPPIRITILYDNYVYTPGTQADWGFACKIEGTPRTILFDTGTRPDILFGNMDKLGVKGEDVDLVVLSHNHGDHTGGLFPFLAKKAKVTVYLPESFPAEFCTRVINAGARLERVGEPIQICPGVWSTGDMGTAIHEQSLILDTPPGLVVITGCSHPGIVDIVKRAREVLKRDVYMVFGGFHLMQHSPQQLQDITAVFRQLGVRKCGPTHCTGDKAIAAFREAYGDDYVTMGVGRVVTIPVD
ncbi:MAG: MBL fold metallo-hydrolase [Acidobacteria bacterium]|nr:MBL fold metallo-hydrolase [Acidobacteriota bacterium]